MLAKKSLTILSDFCFPTFCLVCQEKISRAPLCVVCARRIELISCHDRCSRCFQKIDFLSRCCAEQRHTSSSSSFATERFEPMISLAKAASSCIHSLEMIASLMVVQLCKLDKIMIDTLVPIPDDLIDHTHLAAFMAQLLSCEVVHALEKKTFLLTSQGLELKNRFIYKKNAILSDRNLVIVSVYALDLNQRLQIENILGDSGACHLRFFSFL